MSADDRLKEAAVRCIASLFGFQDDGETNEARARMASEVGAVARDLKDLELPGDVIHMELLLPVEVFLLARYGREPGRRLHATFVEAFAASATRPNLIGNEAETAFASSLLDGPGNYLGENTMEDDRRILEAIASCLTTLIFWRLTPRTRHTDMLMTAELRSALTSVAERGLSPAEILEYVVVPVGKELRTRYGAQEGGRLYSEFVGAYDGAAEPMGFHRSPSR